MLLPLFFFFFFNDTATTEIYTLSLHDALPIRTTTGPPMYRDENGRLSGIVYVDTDTADLVGFVNAAQRRVTERVKLSPGITLDWTGQYEFQVHARKTLQVVLPIVFAAIFFLLTMTFRSASEATIVM